MKMSSFFGMKVSPGRKYRHCVKTSCRVASATLHSGVFLKLWLIVNGKLRYPVTLSNLNPQVQLDMHFAKGDDIILQSMGTGSVSFLGYTTPPAPGKGCTIEELYD